MQLSSTSALVLLWAERECYRGIRAIDYMKQLDLEEGRVLYEKCKKICPYYDQVIKNRKFGVFNLVKQCLEVDSGNLQVIIAGAGFDALGIEVKEFYPNVKVFEIDKENMNTKSHLATISGSIPQKDIEFIEGNLLNTADLQSKLFSHGWNPDEKTLLVLEGISYYIPPKSFQDITDVIKPDWVIFEFLKHDVDITAELVHIPEKVFGLISNSCGLSHIYKYNACQLEQLFDDLSVSICYSMKRLEQIRTGANKFFPTKNSGWIEVCLLAH